MDELLQVNQLKKYFKTPGGMLHAVDGVSLTIDRGKTLGVVGESGCGKSTLGRTILGLLPATSGQILFDGEDVTHAKGKQRKALQRKMQIIFQDPYSSLNPRYCIFELISEPLRTYHLCANKQALQKRVFELMDEVSLARRYAYAYPHELDGGRRQRVGIACALALEPELIVCDEPVSALDVSIQAPGLESAPGSPGGEGADIHFCDPRPVCRQAHFGRHHGDVCGVHRGEMRGGRAVPGAAPPLYKGPSVGDTRAEYSQGAQAHRHAGRVDHAD